MSTYITETMVIVQQAGVSDVEVFLNIKGEISMADSDHNNPDGFLFTFNREDWKELKQFIDRKFEETIE